MARPNNTIRLKPAQRLFPAWNIEPLLIGDEVAGYKAQRTMPGDKESTVLDHKNLTDLCEKIVIIMETRVRETVSV